MEILNPVSDAPSRKSISKGKQLMKDAIQSGLLSENDIAYLKVATDPWHDTSIDSFNGIPDEYVGKSVTEVLTVTHQITTPFATGSGNYNVRVNNNPILGAIPLVKSANFGSCYHNEIDSASPVNTFTIGTIDIQYSLTSNFQDYPAATSRVALALPDSVMYGNIKVAGIGIEVINTTAELYKQGLVSIARVPQPFSSQINTARVFGQGQGGTAGSFAVVEMVPVVSMPTTLTELTTYPDYAQWEAKEGLYSVVRQYDHQSASPMGWRGVVRFINQEPYATSVGTSYSNAAQSVDVDRLNWVTVGTSFMPVATYIQNSGVIPCPCDSVCAMFTGLSEQSTLSLKVKFYVERRVNTSIPVIQALVPFVKDSPPINPKVIELVSRIWSELPPAVMFKENPAGEWWSRILGIIGDVAPTVLGFIPHPVAQIAAKGISAMRAPSKKAEEENENARLKKEIADLKKALQQQTVTPKRAQPQRKLVKAAPPMRKN